MSRPRAELPTFDHLTIVVTDLDEGLRFFAALDFSVMKSVVISGERMDAYMGIAGLEADHVTLAIPDAQPHQEVQLLRYHRPAVVTDDGSGDLGRTGFNHACFRVPDLDAAAARLVAAGFPARNTPLVFHDRKLQFFSGPSNVVIELRAVALTRVVDADGHVLEPASAWRGLPDDVRPRIETDARGLDHVIVGLDDVFIAKLGQMGSPGTDVSGTSTAPVPLEDARPGAFDPIARLADMDAEGIDAAVLYPTIGLGFWGITDPRAAVAVARAYNDWLAAYCAAAPGRLCGAAMVPFQDPRAAVAELHRAREELGFVGAFVRPNPCLGRSIVDDEYEAFWAAAEELGVAVGIHEGFQPAVPSLGADRTPRNILVLHATSHTFEQMFACAQLIANGVLERHPGLRVVFLEAGGGWVPYWLARLDHQVSSYHGYAPEMRLTPSEYFARQCWISFEIDEVTLPALLPFVGADRVVWGSDYPHADSTFPGAVAALRATIAPLGAADQERILGANASQLYRL